MFFFYDKISSAVVNPCSVQNGAISPEGGEWKMTKYESIFVVSTQLEEEKIREIIDKVKSVVESSAQLEKIEEWGRKKLAYEIAKQKEGYYVLMHFTAQPDFPTELERIFKITEGVLRFLVVKRDEKE